MDLIYLVLYTHQKTKKAKTWQDGTLKVLTTGTKAILYDAKGSKLDVLHIRASDVVTGEQLESDRYYIQVEELQKSSSQPASSATTSASFLSNSQCTTTQPSIYSSQTSSGVQIVESRNVSGVKRKRTGFIPPRLVKPRTTESSLLSCGVHPAASSELVQDNVSSSCLLGTVNSLHDSISCEKMSASDLFWGGRGRTRASGDIPQGSFKSADSPQAKPAMKNSPWRTIGSLSSKSSSLLNKSLAGQSIQPERKENGSDIVLSAIPDENEDTSVSLSPSPSYSKPFLVKSCEAPKQFSENLVQSVLDAPAGKRSASEIMALLGKKERIVSVDATKSPSNAGNFTAPHMVSECIQSTEQNHSPSTACDNIRLKETGCHTPVRRNLQDKAIVQKNFSPKVGQIDEKGLECSPCLSDGTDVDGTNMFIHCTSLSQNITTDVTSKLSASTLSLSKYDFEVEGWSGGESVSPESVAKHTFACENEHSQSLSDFDFSQADFQTGSGDDDRKDYLDPRLDWMSVTSRNESPVEVNNEQNTDLSKGTETWHKPCSEPEPPIENDDTAGIHTDIRSKVETVAHPIDDQEVHCSETVEDDLDACFEMSFSPLSEEWRSDEEPSEHRREKGNDKLDAQNAASLNKHRFVNTDNTHTVIPAVSSALGKSAFSSGFEKLSAGQMKQLEEIFDCTEDSCSTGSVKVCQQTDAVATSDLTGSSQPDEKSNRCETKVADCLVQVNSPEKNEGLVSHTRENGSASQIETVKPSHSHDMYSQQNQVPHAVCGDVLCVKSVDTKHYNVSSDVHDDIRTINDLHISPDSFVPTHSSEQSPETPVAVLLSKKTLSKYDSTGRKDIESSEDTFQTDLKGTSDLAWSQTDIKRLKHGVGARSFQQISAEVDVVTVSSDSSDSAFPPVLADTKLSVPSPGLVQGPVCTLTPNRLAIGNTSLTHTGFYSDLCYPDSKSQSCQSSSSARTKVFAGNSVENKICKTDNTFYLNQRVSMHPQNMSDDSDLNPRPQLNDECHVSSASSFPVHRIFQTMSEVLREQEKSNGTSSPSYEEDPASVIRGKWNGDISQSDSFVESLTPDNTDLHLRENIYESQPSPLPHPDRLLQCSESELIAQRKFSATKATDITQAISTQLTNYKMHGMMVSDMVQRPMAYRHEMDHQHDHQQPLSWLSACISQNREGVGQNVRSGERSSMHLQASESTWTPESPLISPTGEIMENSDSSFFINWDEGKPFFIGSQNKEQTNLLQHYDAQQVPLFTGGVSLQKMTQMSSQQQIAGSCSMNITECTRTKPWENCFIQSAADASSCWLKHQNANQNCSNMVCQVRGKKNEGQVMDGRVDVSEVEGRGVVSVGHNIQTVPCVHLEENNAVAPGSRPVCVTSVPEVREENILSPELFSQQVQPQESEMSFKWTQRDRKLRPVVTAPDETITSSVNSQEFMESELKDKISVKGEEFIDVTATSSKQEKGMVSQNQIKKMPCFSSFISIDDSLPTAGGVQQPADSKIVEDELMCREVEDFSGFTDNFLQSDSKGQVLDAGSMTTVCQTVFSPAGKQNRRNIEPGAHDNDTCLPPSTQSLFDRGESVNRNSGRQKSQQSCTVEDTSSNSTAFSPAFVIANSGLDCGEEVEEGDSTAARKRKNELETPLTEWENNSSDSMHRQKKVHKLASQFQRLHPHVYSQGKENCSKLSIGKSYTDAVISHRRTPEPGCDYIQKPFEQVAGLGTMLAPSAPTDSPPLDISPERILKSDMMGSRNSENQSQTFQQTPSPGFAYALFHASSDHLKYRHPMSTANIKTSRLQSPGGFYQAKSHEQNIQIAADYSNPVSDRAEPFVRNVPASRKVGLGKFKKPGVAVISGCLVNSQFQSSLCHELQFWSREEVESQGIPVRQVAIPPSFDSVISYKQILTAALTEFLNIQLFTVAKTYHCALSKVDVSAYTEGVGAVCKQDGGSSNPVCKCGSVSKVAQVKKEGPNKGRFFYVCSGPRNKQCKFFQWVDQQNGNRNSRRAGNDTSVMRPKFSDPASIMSYFHGQGTTLYCHCQFVRRSDNHLFKHGFPKWVRPQQSDSVQKKSLFIKVPKKDLGSTHAKDDLWVISKSLSFAKGETFVARSTFHGPNAQGEVAVDAVAGYSAFLWDDGSVCHAVHCGNAATELTCMSNIQDHVDMTSLPLLPHLLNCQPCNGLSSKASSKGFKAPTVIKEGSGKLHVPSQFVHGLAADFISKYHLNTDQAQAVRQAASMMDKDADPVTSVLLIHGVFGAGKSFLLSVLILFMVELFQRNDSYSPGVPFPWKLLLSSTTNVAVDRVLQGLLELGFDNFVRVGSMKKIAKPVLPYSMHASGSDNQELKDLQEMLKSQDITAAERHCVRKSIERHRLGENRKRLGAVRVVGVTCAACSFQCLDKMQFPFVVLDECSQMTEPASLLPIARSACEKLVLVGDPKGYDPVMLRIQYRCHPLISAVSNSLFYHNQLLDGITPEDRRPVLDLFPTMCFYDVSCGQEMTNSTGSFVNEAEAQFVTLLLSVLMVRGLQPASVGVITLYRAQAHRILDIIRQSKSGAHHEMTGVQVSTVDAFQGGERDIIILSCVRTHSVGFIDSIKRMNVALTRARHHLLIVGCQRNLHSNRCWAQVINHCQGLTGGVMSASTASRQLQTVLDQAYGDQQDSTTADAAAARKCPTQDKQDAGRKRNSVSQKGSRNQTVLNTPLPAMSDTIITTQHLQSEDVHCLQSDPKESPLKASVEMEDQGAVPENPQHSEEFIPEMECVGSKARHSQVKPLIIEEEEDVSSDDDFLPDGLF